MIGGAPQVGRGLLVLGEHGDTDAHGDGHLVRHAIEAFDANGGALHQRAETFGDRAHVGQVHGLGEQHRELFTAPAADRVERADSTAQRLGDLHQHVIAGFVAEAAIEGLEVVDVGDAQRHRCAFAMGTRHFIEQLQVEVGAVVGPGQRIDEYQCLDA